MPKLLKIWLAVGGLVLIAVVVFAVRFVMYPTKDYQNEGPSMEPTLFANQPFTAGPSSDIERGDIVVYHSPGDRVDNVKRVVAIGGDHVRIEPGCTLEVGGATLTREAVECPEGDYLGTSEDERRCFREGGAASASRVILDSGSGCRPTDLEVPSGHVFVLGDHRDRSNDSSNPHVGAIPVEQVVGVVELD